MVQQCLSVILLPFSTHTLQYHLLADDTQSYDHTSVSAVPSLLTRLSSCVADLANSYASLRLQLNPAKTEFILFGSHRSLAKFSDDSRAITVCSSVIQCTNVVRDLGILLDCEMTMQRHISKVTIVCFYHLRRLQRQIRNYVKQTLMAQLVMSLVITRIDYCNSILAGLPACRLVPLRRVQNATARLVLNLDRRAHISPALQQLHWIPVKHRVTFKIATLMHQILQRRCPSYLADLVTFNMTYSQRRHLRSSTTRSAAIRRTQTQFGKRAFSVLRYRCLE